MVCKWMVIRHNKNNIITDNNWLIIMVNRKLYYVWYKWSDQLCTIHIGYNTVRDEYSCTIIWISESYNMLADKWHNDNLRDCVAVRPQER